MTLGEQGTKNTARWRLLRDMLVLQGKLIVDGLRDLLLVPASLIAGLISLIAGDADRPGPQFYQLLAYGKQSERWINLFGALRNAPDEVNDLRDFASQDADDLVQKVEAFVVEEYKRGGVTTQAKDQLDKILDALKRRKTNKS